MGEAVAKMNRLREGNRWEKSERQGGERERQKKRDGGAHETGCGGAEKKGGQGRQRQRQREERGEEAGGQTERLG